MRKCTLELWHDVLCSPTFLSYITHTYTSWNFQRRQVASDTVISIREGSKQENGLMGRFLISRI